MDPVGLLLSNVETTSPWDADNARLGDAERARTAPPCCPFCGNRVKTHNALEAQRKHLNSLLTNAYLHAVVPQVPGSENKSGSKQIEVPWARTGSEFTLMFESLVIALIRRIPVKSAAAILGSGDARLWRLFDHEAGEESADPCADSSPAQEVWYSRKGPGFLDLSYDLEISFETRTEERGTSAEAGQQAVNKGSCRYLAARSRGLYTPFILAAVAALFRAALDHQQFRITGTLSDALGKVSAEEGLLDPGKSRAPP